MTQRFRGLVPALMTVCVFVTSVLPARATEGPTIIQARATEGPTITQAIVDDTAHTLTAYLVNVRANRRREAPPRVSLGNVPLTVTSATVDIATHTAVLTMALPDPIPVGSFLLQVAWGNAGDDDGLAFDVTLGAVGPVGAQASQGPMGPSGPQGPAGAQGAQGPSGAQGPQGPKGDTGVAGATGGQGIQGPPGVDGLPGGQGDVGPQGPPGIPGAAGSVLVGAKNWFLDLPNGASWSIPTDGILAPMPGSGFMAETTGGSLEISVTLGGIFLPTFSQFSCMPAIDGEWAGRAGFAGAPQASQPFVEGIEFNTTANLLVVTWSRSRVYSDISARPRPHLFDVRCWASGPSAPQVGSSWVNSLTVKEIR